MSHFEPACNISFLRRLNSAFVALSWGSLNRAPTENKAVRVLQFETIHFDIAAVVIMAVALASLILRRMTRGATNRVYLSAMVLVTLTAVTCLIGELYDIYIMAGPPGSGGESVTRNAISLIYYALRTLTAPAYLILIATVSSTTHRLNRGAAVRILLWTPMIAVLAFVLTNPIHHLVFVYEDGVPQRGPLMGIVYAVAAYYSAIALGWLIRWREVLGMAEFYTMLALFPVVMFSVVVQFAFPRLHIEMFVLSVAMLLLSAFVIRPENRMDASVNAASLHAYREMCRRAFLTEKPLCLVYLEIVNLEKLRELVGKDELQDVIRHVSSKLTSLLSNSDTLYYLRNGLFCIAPRNTNADRAVRIARQAHEEGKARSLAQDERVPRTEMRTCIVRIPEDATSNDTLKVFVRRFSHLVPHSEVTTFEELSRHEGFDLQMALSGIVERAIEDRSFAVYYQPIWCVPERRFHSAEALVRLEDPRFGHVPPSMFIPEAEQNGSIVEIGEILLEKICAFLGTVDFERTGLKYVEVNLSVDQCVRPELTGEILGLMRTYGVEPNRVNLEITETSSTYSQRAIDENARQLAEAGLTFSLDDYGTGYSNISRLLSLPFSLVKLDKSLVDKLDDPNTRTLVANVIATMKSIGKAVLAEGVETVEQADALSAMSIDYIQGYYFAKPLPESEFVAFLAERN